MRELSLADLTAIVALDQLCFDDEWSVGQWQSYLSNHHRFLALPIDYHNRLVGFALYSYLFDEAELLRICVEPEHRGLGLSVHAMSLHIASLRRKGVHRLMLEVRESNRPARGLYTTLGFAVDGVRKDYYPACGDAPKEDAILMSLKLVG